MLKNRTRLAVTAGAVAAAGVIAMGGAAVASAAPHPGVSGTETFQLMGTSARSSKFSAIAQGVFTAGGTQTRSSNTSSTETFPTGTVTIKHSRGTGSQHLNPVTCLLTINLHGTFSLSGGTGAYAGITGSGTYKLTALGVANKVAGKCSLKAVPQAFQQVVLATGSVTLP